MSDDQDHLRDDPTLPGHHATRHPLDRGAPRSITLYDETDTPHTFTADESNVIAIPAGHWYQHPSTDQPRSTL